MQSNSAFDAVISDAVTFDAVTGAVMKAPSHAPDDRTLLSFIHPSQQEAYRTLHEELIEGKRNDYHLYAHICTSGAAWVWGKLHVSAVRGAEGELKHCVVLFDDLTERERVWEEQRNEREQSHAETIQTLTESAETLQRWLNILVNISRRIANLESVDTILLTIVRLAQRLLRSDLVAAALWDESRTRLEVKYLAVPRSARIVDDCIVETPLILRTLRSCRAFRYPDERAVNKAVWTFNGREVKSGIIVPLMMNNESVGGLWIGSYRRKQYSLIDLLGVKSLAEQATIALEHGLMRSRLQSLAVLEERSRIAREMHDSVVQILGYVSMQMLILDQLIRRNECAAALEALQTTRENVRAAQSDVRDNILSLRTTLAGEEGYLPALEKYLEEFGQHADIQVHFKNDAGDPPRLSPLAEVQLVRIVQEVLTNVRKHAQAHHVWFQMWLEDGLMLSIRDDGIGFETSAAPCHFGLQTMRERADSVQGKLEIHSQPGAGTRVDLWLPLVDD